MPATLWEFAQVNDAAAATTKKLIKQEILAKYLRSLDDHDLRLAVRFAAGRAFAATDERVLNVGGAIVSQVILRLLKLDPNVYHQHVIQTGEIGEAIGTLWPPRISLAPSRTESLNPVTLQELSRAFDDLASTGNTQRKREILRDLFSRCAESREAVYLAKLIFGDMRTGVQEGVLQQAIAQAFQKDAKLVQRCQLLIGNLDEVAVRATHDTLHEAKFQLFHPIQFMLATPQEDTQEAAVTMAGRTFYAEDKLDGIRAQVHKSGQRVAIYTRTMDRTDESFPDVVDAIREMPSEFLLDGEIVPYHDGCVLPFAHIQRRLGRKVLTPKILRENPATFIAFDILYKDGELLMDKPLGERREVLVRFVGAGSRKAGGDPASPSLPDAARATQASPLHTRVTQVSTADEIESAFVSARECRNEGLVLKDPGSPYTPGRRGQAWLKLKTHLPTFDCVVTAAEFGHGKRRSTLSDYTFAVWDREPTEVGAQLVNIGKAYSGVTDEEIAQLTELFLKLSRAQHGHVHLVEPKVVMEIACDQIQKSNRHASGYALRFPRIKRIRWDKRPEEADRLERIIAIYESSKNFARGTVAALEPAPEPSLFDFP